jgi:hypothetical protein
MSRKLWMILAISQIIGVTLAAYSARFEVGAGGVREFLWIPAMIALFPGILLGYVADALGFANYLGHWYGLPFFASVVLLNVGCWNLVGLLSRRRRHLLKA